MIKLAAAAKLYDTKFAELESLGFSEHDAWVAALAAVRAVFRRSYHAPAFNHIVR